MYIYYLCAVWHKRKLCKLEKLHTKRYSDYGYAEYQPESKMFKR